MGVIKYTEEVRHYINLIQDNINRMAANSANCKTWLITLITADLIFSRGTLLHNMWILLFPTMLFFLIDCYYLGLERRFIRVETEFLKKLKECEDVSEFLYSFNIHQFGSNAKWTFEAMKSWSTTPFYITVIIFIITIVIISR